MRKITVFMFVFALLTLTMTQLVPANYSVFNGRDTTNAWVTYSYWNGNFYRTRGWYKVEPGELQQLYVPSWVVDVYVRIERNGLVRPSNHATRLNYILWIHPRKAFTVHEDVVNDAIAYSSVNRAELVKTAGFYKYSNGGRFTISGPLAGLTEAEINLLQSKRKLDSATLIDGLLIDKSQMRSRTSSKHGLLKNTFRHYGDSHFILLDQFDNTCGTTSAEMILHYYAKEVGQGDIWEAGDVHRVEAGSFPGELREALTDLGVPATWYHQLTLNHLKYYVRQNRPPIILLRFDNVLHYVVVVGYNTYGDFLVADPNNVFRWLTSDEMRRSWSLDSPGIPNDRYSVENGFEKFGLEVAVPFVDVLTGGENGIVPKYAPTHQFPVNWSELTAHEINGDHDWNPLVRTRYWERTFNFAYDFADYKVSSIKPVSVSSALGTAEAYIQGHEKIGSNKVRVWGRIEYGRITRGKIWVLVRAYRHDKGNRVSAAPQGVALSEPLDVRPAETSLLPNYPNPFNPETWISYHLAHAADVTLTLYDPKGVLVRRLELGHQRAGIYQSKSRAAYWDGNNAQGEPVASGIYFYTLKAGNFTATKKMLVKN